MTEAATKATFSERKTLSAAFHEKITGEPNSGCWLWTGTNDGRHGYGRIWLDGKMRYAHRVGYELLAGSIPEGLELDHLCRVPCCVNPDHLVPVSHRENCRRGITGAVNGAREAAKTHCKRGHPYNKVNTFVDRKGKRVCRTCKRMLEKAGHKRRKT